MVAMPFLYLEVNYNSNGFGQSYSCFILIRMFLLGELLVLKSEWAYQHLEAAKSKMCSHTYQMAVVPF